MIILVHVKGPPGTGKTTVVERLKAAFPPPSILRALDLDRIDDANAQLLLDSSQPEDQRLYTSPYDQGDFLDRKRQMNWQTLREYVEICGREGVQIIVCAGLVMDLSDVATHRYYMPIDTRTMVVRVNKRHLALIKQQMNQLEAILDDEPNLSKLQLRIMHTYQLRTPFFFDEDKANFFNMRSEFQADITNYDYLSADQIFDRVSAWMLDTNYRDSAGGVPTMATLLERMPAAAIHVDPTPPPPPTMNTNPFTVVPTFDEKTRDDLETRLLQQIQEILGPTFTQTPEGIFWRDHGRYDVRKLWNATRNVVATPMNVSELARFNLYKEYWPTTVASAYGILRQVSPYEVLQTPQVSPEDAARIDNADLSFPIQVYDKAGEWDVLDGLHRLAKAVRLGEVTIQAQIVTPSMLEEARVGNM